jgi:4-hydroxy-tetrahydrodipicolinate synthase
VGGTTGEAFSLSTPELKTLIQGAKEVAGPDFKIIGGAGSINFEDTLNRCKEAESAGADALLIVTPPYLKPSQEALINYYQTLHDACSLPIILYNNPGRAGVSIQDETLIHLSTLPRIVGIKESSDHASRVTALKSHLPKNFYFLAGEDATIASFLAQGASGWISATGNLFPNICAQLYQAWKKEDLTTFAKLRDFLYPVSQILFKESNPGPVKYALSLLHPIDPYMRAPLSPISERLAQQIKDVLQSQIGIKDLLIAYA